MSNKSKATVRKSEVAVKPVSFADAFQKVHAVSTDSFTFKAEDLISPEVCSYENGKVVMNPTALSPVEGGNGTSIVLSCLKNGEQKKYRFWSSQIRSLISALFAGEIMEGVTSDDFSVTVQTAKEVTLRNGSKSPNILRGVQGLDPLKASNFATASVVSAEVE
jgi:hypothetical protein